MSLAIFDLDNTLIAGDSDVLWGEFLVEQGHVNKTHYQKQNQQFYTDYQNGTLDIQKYLAFALAPLTQFDQKQLKELHNRFMSEKIKPIMLSKAYTLIEQHRAQNDCLLIITATNDFISAPIAKALNIPNILASSAEIKSGLYTGKSYGVPCFQEGKVTRLNQWLQDNNQNLHNSYFYSDSANDIPLLKVVSNPVAVDPDERLTNFANKNKIPIISLR